MAELGTFNAATHLKNGIDTIEQPSQTTVTPDGNLHQPNPEPQNPEPSNDTPAQSEATPPATPAQEPAATPTAGPPENEFAFSLGAAEGTPTPDNPAQPAAPIYNWKEEIGKVDKKELYAHLGLNDFAIKLNDHLLKGGKAQDFISINGIDFDTVPDEDLVRQDINAKYPNLSPSEKNRMYERLYGIDDNLTEQEKEDKAIDLKSAAYQVRIAKKNEQSNYQMPEPIPVKDEAYTNWQNQNKEQEKLQTQITNYYNEHPATKALKESKRVAINLGEGVAPFNIVLSDNDATALTNKMAQSALYKPPMLTKTGELDVARHQLTEIFESNPQAFINEIFNYGKKMGLRGVVKEGQNAQRTTTPVSTITPQETHYGTGTYNPAKHGK